MCFKFLERNLVFNGIVIKSYKVKIERGGIGMLFGEVASIARCFTSKLWKYPSGALGDGGPGVELDHVEPNRFLASTRAFSQCQGRKGYFLIIFPICSMGW